MDEHLERVDLADVGTGVPVRSVNTVIVGTGAAGYCTAERLWLDGQHDLLMVTDKIRAGTSRNAGSDKQTYYKLTLAGDGEDSVRDLARTLFEGGAMDGDNALVEAALSIRCFLHLCELGVSFPTDEYGQFVGYKTDHDPRERATSAGPYTSRAMTEQLEKQVQSFGVPVLEDCRVVDLVVQDGTVIGLLCLRLIPENEAAEIPGWGGRFLLIRATNVVLATGGPAGMYADSVYPHGQWGATGAALRAGAPGKNLTEWQFGLASVAPRWNVSGSYLQVVPRIVSTDEHGDDEREFLADTIGDPGLLANLVFLKGYQWPFDARKAADGSSAIDLLVYRETAQRGRRVYLDFSRNPAGGGGSLAIERLSAEARTYWERTGLAQLGPNSTPVQRLRQLNEPAYQFYLERNPHIDLAVDPLQIAVCAQHNNGGLEVDCWWTTPLPGLFAVGEVAAAHGVYRPGGASLNSGQVGATRAAQFIARWRREPPVDASAFARCAIPFVAKAVGLLEAAAQRYRAGQPDNTATIVQEAGALMSTHAGLVRSPESIAEAFDLTRQRLQGYDRQVSADPASRRSIDRIFLGHDILTSQYVYLAAMADYLEHGGHSRGSVLYRDPDGRLPTAGGTDLPLGEEFRFTVDEGALDGVTQIATWQGEQGLPTFDWRPVRPIPTTQASFERVWQAYRENVALDNSISSIQVNPDY